MAVIGISPTKAAHQCAHCHNQFFPKRTDRVTFCSRKCAFAHKAANKVTPEEKARRYRERFQPAQPRTVNCLHCGEAFTIKGNGKVCSPECAAARARANARLANIAAVGVKRHTCKECSSEFSPAYGDKSRAYCSEECARKSARRSRPRGNDRKRARAFGVEYEYVNPIKVLRRDNWTCQLCGRKTPQELRGTFRPNAPEVDHIQPISKGGAHTYANLQCACRACNMAKGDTPMGQLKLFAA